MKPYGNHVWQSSGFPTSTIARAMALFALLVTGSEAVLGDSWNVVNTGLPVNDDRVLVTDPINPRTVYVGGAGGLFKSVDGVSPVWNLGERVSYGHSSTVGQGPDCRGRLDHSLTALQSIPVYQKISSPVALSR